jgi:hypothetical protein
MPEIPFPPVTPTEGGPSDQPPYTADQLRAMGLGSLVTPEPLEPDPIQPLPTASFSGPAPDPYLETLSPILPNPRKEYADAFKLTRFRNQQAESAYAASTPSQNPPPVQPEGSSPDAGEPPARPRRRGGQPGNLNALKHGLYIDGYRLKNTTPIERASLFDLNELIENIKSYMRYTYEYGIRTKNLAEINETMRSLSLAGMSLTRLITVHDESISTPLPGDMKVTRRTSVNHVIDHLRKKLESVMDLSDLDTRFLDDQ